MAGKVKAEAAKKDSSSEEEDDKKDGDDNGVLFYVNKDGFPIRDEVWDRMWRHVSKLNPDSEEAASKIRGNPCLPKVPVVSPPVLSTSMSIEDKLNSIQRYMEQLQYNHTGTQFFCVRKNRPFSGLMDVAKEMIRESLPIKCLEAVILALYLSSGIQGLERFAIGFKTQFASNFHKHIVLGVCYGGRFGTLGVSRRKDLMNKPLAYKNLNDLVDEFKTCYQNNHHAVKKVNISLPIVHDVHSHEKISWQYISIDYVKDSKNDVSKVLEKYSRELRTMCKASHYREVKHIKTQPTPSAARTDQKSNKNAQVDTARSQAEETSDQSKEDLNGYQIRV